MQYTKQEIQNDHSKKNDLIIFIKDNLTFRDYLIFNKIVELIQSKQYTNICIDMEDCTFVDSAGLGMFVIAQDEAQKSKTNITLKNLNKSVKDLFCTARFDTLYNIED